MKIIKKILIGFLVFIAVTLIAAAIAPKGFQSQSEIVINKPKNEVFEYIKYVRNQDHYGVWQKSDPEAKYVSEGRDGTVGFKYSWEGEKVGVGSQTITEIIENEKLETALYFGFGAPATSTITTEALAPDQTRVTWGFEGKSPYPLNLVSLFYDTSGDFEEGLRNLKEILEQ